MLVALVAAIVVVVVVPVDMDAENNTGHSNMVDFLLCPTGAIFVVSVAVVIAVAGAMVWMDGVLLVVIVVLVLVVAVIVVRAAVATEPTT